MAITIEVIECAACGHSSTHSPTLGCCECECQDFRPVEMAETNPAWEAIYAEAGRVGWPTAYTSDLFRDWQAIQRAGPQAPFVWVLRPYGTHWIATEHPTDQDREWARSYSAAIRQTNPEARWYFWDGAQLTGYVPRA